jgi:hypothetical protein
MINEAEDTLWKGTVLWLADLISWPQIYEITFICKYYNIFQRLWKE